MCSLSPIGMFAAKERVSRRPAIDDAARARLRLTSSPRGETLRSEYCNCNCRDACAHCDESNFSWILIAMERVSKSEVKSQVASILRGRFSNNVACLFMFEERSNLLGLTLSSHTRLPGSSKWFKKYDMALMTTYHELLEPWPLLSKRQVNEVA